MLARLDLGERKEFKFNFHFAFQLGKIGRTADVKAALFLRGRLGFSSGAIAGSSVSGQKCLCCSSLCSARWTHPRHSTEQIFHLQPQVPWPSPRPGRIRGDHQSPLPCWDTGAAPGGGAGPDHGFGDRNSSSRVRAAVSGLNLRVLISCFAL